MLYRKILVSDRQPEIGVEVDTNLGRWVRHIDDKYTYVLLKYWFEPVYEKTDKEIMKAQQSLMMSTNDKNNQDDKLRTYEPD